MACLRLGSKSEVFHREGQTWVCSTGLPSDITIEVGDVSFHLHKFPLLSRSGLLEKLIEDFNNSLDPNSQEPQSSSSSCALQLHDLPGGPKAFELIARFCYGVKTELSSSTVAALRCASEYLQMTEEFEEGNLISITESFLNDVLSSWPDTLKALQTAEQVLPLAEDLHIISRCIESLAAKACSNPNMINIPPNLNLNDNRATQTTSITSLWNGISSPSNHDPNTTPGDKWWFNDVSFLSLPLYKRLIISMESKSMNRNTISSSIIHYAKKYLPLMTPSTSNDTNQPVASSIPETDQRDLLEELVSLLPNKRGVTSSKTLLKLLRIAMTLRTNPNTLESLEKRVGVQLDQARLVDLLIPNMGYSVETLYDVDCVQRILGHFMAFDSNRGDGDDNDNDDGVVVVANEGVTSVAIVADLIDAYLAEVGVDVNLKIGKFESLASVIPDYVRAVDDGIYKAVDVFLKAHPWVTETEREEVCRLMNCQKLSMDASSHAAQNERLPLRVLVQVLFFEQLRLRTSISGWFFVDDAGLDLRLRVSEVEKECSLLRNELHLLNPINAKKKKKKRSNNAASYLTSLFHRRFGFIIRARSEIIN